MNAQNRPHCRTRVTCRACGKEDPRLFLSLGPTPLANSFPSTAEEFDDEPFFPLDVYFCEQCSLVQLLLVVDPEFLFRDYIYVTGTSETMSAHNLDCARSVVEKLNLQPGDLVVEAASNDGSLLRCFQQHRVKTLGIEPARNIAEAARASGVETLAEFFDSTVAQGIRHSRGPAKVVIGNNVLAHVDDAVGFLEGCRELLDGDGRVVLEFPYLADLVESLEYDTIYHEHLSYFSVTALTFLFDAAGLSIVDVEKTAVHGGSLRVYGGHGNGSGHSEIVSELTEKEQAAGLLQFSRYERFAEEVRNNKAALVELLTNLKEQGSSIAGYGAPAKGNTLLNYCGIGVDLVPFTVDKNPLKVDRFTPGAHIPVRAVPSLLEERPDYILILAWNFAHEIIEQERACCEAGSRFIIPIPSAEVV